MILWHVRQDLQDFSKNKNYKKSAFDRILLAEMKVGLYFIQ